MLRPIPPPCPPLLWDVFCRVIDNFGDIGVCWRLCAELAHQGQQVRLWVDDASALAWIAPGAQPGQWPSVQVLPWAASHDPQQLAQLAPAQVWVEAFGCEIAPEFIASRAQSTRATGQNGTHKPVWINLEYLSAESYVERAHGLPSPVMHGPAAGWVKHFFYPGFTPRTGGLLREAALAERQAAFAQPGVRAAWLAQQGVPWQGERLVSLFCYEPATLAAWLAQLDQAPDPTLLLVTPGRAQQAVNALPAPQGQLRIHALPPLSQTDFDQLLWACDFNCVRGEDSLVRALWAGKPLLWQIYPQDDAAHHAKLEAFLAMLPASASLRQLHYAWNGLGGPLPAPDWADWGAQVQSCRTRLAQVKDLSQQLHEYVAKNR